VNEFVAAYRDRFPQFDVLALQGTGRFGVPADALDRKDLHVAILPSKRTGSG
jgi:hypothetical protein